MQQAMHSDLTEQNDNFRLEQGNLAHQIRPADVYFSGFRGTIAGGPTFNRISDIDLVAPAKVERSEHVVEQLTGLANEGLSLRIFLGARSFANKQPVWIEITDTKYGLLAVLAERAGFVGGSGGAR